MWTASADEQKSVNGIGSLCPISVEGVIRVLRWGIGPEGGKALSSHHIWPFIPPARPSGKIGGGVLVTYVRTYVQTGGCTDVQNERPYVMR
jgi:hypothetical protein